MGVETRSVHLFLGVVVGDCLVPEGLDLVMDFGVPLGPDVYLIQQEGMHEPDDAADDGRARELVGGGSDNYCLLMESPRANAGGVVGSGCGRCSHRRHPVDATRVPPSVYFLDEATIHM